MVLCILAPILVLPPHAMALPSGGQVVAGDVTITGGAGVMDISQGSQAAIVNWSDFSIGASEIVNILQNSPDAALLNRVMGANPSELLGQLNANGRVFLINPNGVVVGRDASINAMEFVASALDVADQDFLDGGDLAFSGESTAGVLNLGTITATNGDVILVAYKVANEGTIEAPQGVAALAAGQEVMLSPDGDQRVLVKTHLPGLATGGAIGVDNSGVIAAAQAELKAAGGNIYELAINQTGVVRAKGVAEINGRVMLTSDAGKIEVEGSLAAHDADGSGGEILIGGDYRGQNSAVDNASFATVGADALVDVSATAPEAGGGRAIVWADQQTDFAGRIDGRAGELGGDGAFAEVSGGSILNYSGFADLRAASGATGTLLLDPTEVVISSATDDQINGVFNSTVLANNLGGANVVVEASNSGSIAVNDSVTWTGGTSLTLNAGDSIFVNADLTGDAGSQIFFGLGSKFFGDSASRAKLTVATDASVTASQVTIRRNPNSPDGGALGIGQGIPGEGPYGSIDFGGILRADTLDLVFGRDGILGDVFVGNAANEIGRVSTPGATLFSRIDGDMRLVDGSGGLEISGQLRVGSDNALEISTAGDLTLLAGTELVAFNTDVVLASTGGSFINQAGSTAISNIDAGRALIYSGNPADTVLDSLAFTPVYNKTFSGNAPGTITQQGNRVLYRLAPTITFTADNFTRTYGADNPLLSYTVSGLVGGDTAAQAFSGTPTLSVAATSASDAGTYVISNAADNVLASDYDYQFAFVPGTLTVNPAALTIRADDQTRFVGVPNPSFTASFEGLVNGDTEAAVPGLMFNTTASLDSPGGSYPIIPFGAANPNYAITFIDGLLTVGDSTITIRANDFSRFFGDANPIFTGAVSAPAGFDFDLLSNLNYSATATDRSNVGSYGITPTVDALSGINFNLIPGTLTINPRPLTIAASSASRLYGSANPGFFGTLTGLADFHTAEDIAGLDYVSSATQASDAGAYAITPTTAANPNYAITPVEGTLTIQPAPLTITADDVSKIYADLDPVFSASDSGLVLDQAIADLGSLQLESGTVQLSPAGQYAITPSFTSATSLASNYAISFEPGTFTIQQRPLVLTAEDASRSYGEADPTFRYTSVGINPPGITNASLGAFDGVRVESAASARSDAGSYTLTVGGGSNPNFAYQYEPGTFTITPAALSVTADSVARLYGAENPAFTSRVSGLQFTDTLADVLGGFSLSTSATAASDSGTYPILPEGNQINFNYAVSLVPGTLSVNKAPLFIAPNLSSRLYGDPDPAFTISATGLVNGDTSSVVQNLSFQTASPFVGVGNYPVNILGASARNYQLSFGTGSMNVLARPLTITADSFSREYGEVNPVFTASFDNLASFDTAADISGLSLSTPATAASNVLAGGYGIQVSSDLNPNYAISYVPGTLSITPAPLLLEMGNASRVYGEANPAPTTGIATGFKLDDTIDTLGLELVTSATPGSDVGSYLFSATSANPNYTVNVSGGQLSVTPAPLSVSVDDLSRSYGDANPEPTVRLGGLKFEADRAGAVEVVNPATPFDDVGSYAFGARVLDSNYTLAGVQGDLFVTPRLLNLNASASRLFGEDNPAAAAFTLTGNFANGDLAADIVGFNYSTSLVRGSDVGTYDLSAGSQVSLLSSNYSLNSVTSSLAITPRPIDINIGDYERLYGDANPDFALVGATNIPSFDTVDEVVRIVAPDERTVPGNYSLEAEIINPNYTVGTLGFGRLAILPRELMITVANVARYYGDLNPAFSASFGGDGLPDFVDPDSFLELRTIAPTGRTANAGHYLISMLDASFDADLYSLVSFAPGVLSVFPRPVTLNVGNTEFAVAPDAVLEDVADFAGANFSISGANFTNGQSAASQFPGLEYVVTESPAATPVGVGVDLNNYTAPSLADFISGSAPLAGVEVDAVAAAQYVAPVVAAASGMGSETVEVAVVAVEIGSESTASSVDTSLGVFIPVTSIGSNEVRVTRSIGLSGGYLNTNPNYVVTAVNNGVLTLRNRTAIEEQIKISQDYAQQDHTIVVRAPSDYRANIGLLLSDFPELSENIVSDYLEGLYNNGGMRGDDLYRAIFGDETAVAPPFDPAVIRAWLSDIATNAEKRGTMALAMVGYLQGLQGKDSVDYTAAERLLVTAVTGKVQEDREAFANTLRAREQSFEDYPNASRIYYGAREQLSVIEKRAAVAATGFLDFERANMTEDEIRVAEAIQASVLDGENASTMALIEEWFEVRGDRRGSALIDGQFAGMLSEMGDFKAMADSAQASIASGQDQGAGLPTGMQGAYDFVNIEPPYGDFLKETAIAGLEAKMARYDLADAIGGASAAATGVAAGAAASSAVTSAGTALSAQLIPYVMVSGHGLTTTFASTSAATGAGAAAAGTVSTVATGAAIFVTASVAVAIAGTITLVQQEEKKAIYEGIMEQGFGPMSLTDLNLSASPADPGADARPEDVPDQIMQTLLVQSLESMLIGI